MTKPDYTAIAQAVADAERRTAAQTTCVRHVDSLLDAYGFCMDCEAERENEVANRYWLEELEGQIRERVPLRFRSAVTDRADVLAWAAQFAADPATAPSLLLLGPTGTGKTHQAYAAARVALTARKATWLATTATDMFATLRPRTGVDTEAVMDRYRNTMLLLIDDVGVAKQSEWVEEVTYRVLNGRYEQMRPTVITSNLVLPDLKHALGDRVASRLAETSVRIVLDGPDRRRLP